MQTPEEQIITQDELAKWSQDFQTATAQHVAQNAVMKNGIMASAENIDLIKKLSPPNFAFSVDVDREAVANQKQSGRCWMFAALNTLRWHIEKNLELPHGTFELSQAFLAFYNKLERAAWFLEHVIQTADKDLGDREVEYLLSAPMEDGGYFDWIAGLITKYGVIPHECMSETYCTNNTAEVNAILSQLLRKDAIKLRRMANENQDTTQVMRDMLGEVYRVLAVCFGEPPQKIDFEYMDKKNEYHGVFGLTPKEFMEKYVPIDLSNYVAVANFPGENRPYNRTYTIQDSNQIPNREILYLNVPMEDLKSLVIKQLDGGKGEPIWFASDVLAYSDRMAGVMSPHLYDFNTLFGIDLQMDKADGLDTQQFGPDHAMVIAGVDIVEGKPTKWKIENSWGTENGGKPTGNNGYFSACDEWFDNFVYVAAIKKDLLSADQQKALTGEPIVLPFSTPL